MYSKNYLKYYNISTDFILTQKKPGKVIRLFLLAKSTFAKKEIKIKKAFFFVVKIFVL